MAFANSPVAMKRRAARSRTLRSLVMPCSFHRSLVQTDVQIGCRASGEAFQIDVWSLSARILSGLDIESDDPAIREDKLTGPASGWHEPRYAAPLPRYGTSVTSRVWPGSKRTAVPAAMSSRW